MTFLLVLTLSIGVRTMPMGSDLACNAAVMQAQVIAARDYPGAVFVSARCERA